MRINQPLSLPNTKVHFITFANTGYTSPERILEQAKSSGYFTNLQVYSEMDIEKLINHHKSYFKRTSKVGYGHFIWKPFIISNHLLKIPDGEFLFYSDLGMHINFNENANAKFNEYLYKLLSENSLFGVFETSKAYNARGLATASVINAYFPQFADLQSWIYVYGSPLFILNCPESRRILGDWLMLCEKYLPKAYSQVRRYFFSDLIYLDADNGLLNIVLAKHGRCSFFDGREINLYSEDGLQLKHCLTPQEYQNVDWSSLQNFPFINKRDR
jgi:hypothetical protein